MMLNVICSMTGYGRGEAQEKGKKFVVEIKTVNHKYSDINLKLPKQVSFLEKTARDIIMEKISRGKADVYVTYEDTGDEARTVVVDRQLIQQYVRACRSLKDEYGFTDEISLSLISGFPDVFKVERPEGDEEQAAQVFLKAAADALDSLMRMRLIEGEKLEADIRANLRHIEESLEDIEKRAPLVVTEYKEKLESRIKEILQQQVIDEYRLATEVAYFADRCCINEEIVRLKSHLKQMEEILASDEPAGRKMDFLVQEMNREINTIGSKSNDLGITRNVVDIKSYIDKIREQVQNIE
jgi:uncharacterized protein (TIGR00255 family)